MGHEPFRGAVDGSGQAGRPGTDDDEVAQPPRGPLGAAADERRELGDAGIAQDTVAPDHDRGLGRTDAQPAQQGLRASLRIEVDEPVRQAVAGRELPQRAGARGVPGPDDPEALSVPDGEVSPGQAGPNDLVGEGWVAHRAVPQALGGDLQHLTGVQRGRREERHLPGEQAELAEEAAGAVHPDDARIRPGTLDDGNSPGQHDDEVLLRAALDDQQLAPSGRAHLAVRRQQSDLIVGQARVGAREVGCLAARCRVEQLLESGRGRLRAHANASST